MANDDKLVKLPPPVEGYWPRWLSWRPTSESLLHVAESKVLSYLKNAVQLFYVPNKDGKSLLRTLRAYKNAKYHQCEKMPLVLLHGMGAGIGLWCKNIDPLSENRVLYAMDLLGFARSARLVFPNDSLEVEKSYIESIENWRINMGLEKIILLGHSMGGYLAYAYAAKHPDRVRHLILADPWGFPQKDTKIKIKRSLFINTLIGIFKNMDPLAILRYSGPFGPYLIKRYRPDLGYYFNHDHECNEICKDIIDNKDDHIGIYEYIYHCNAQTPSSGEKAFKSLCLEMGWARHPMVGRIEELPKSVPVTFLYGENSWMDVKCGIEFYNTRKDSYVDVHLIPKCGHHIYAEDSKYFNHLVNIIAEKVDSNEDSPGSVMLETEKLVQNNPFFSRNRGNSKQSTESTENEEK